MIDQERTSAAPDAFQAETIWRPAPDARTTTRMGRFLGAVEADLGRSIAGYQDLWDWSVAEPEAFWSAIRDHFDLPIHGERSVLDLGEESPSGLPGATWFAGARLNAAVRAAARRWA